MQNVALSIGALLLLASGGAVQAQSDAKIGFVNLNAIIQAAPQIQEMSTKLRDEFAVREAEFQLLTAEYDELADTYERDASVMGEAERQSMERRLTQMTRDLERRSVELQEDLQIRQNELVAELQQTIVRQVQEYAEEEGYDLVVTEAVYVSAEMDISAEVYEAITGQPVPSADD
jgi:outer membrane protein